MLTSWLDLVGALLLVAAVVVLVWPWSAAAALAAGGVSVLVFSWLVDRRMLAGSKGRES